MAWGAIAVTAVTTIGGIIQSNKNAEKADKALEAQEIKQKAAKQRLEAQKEKYKAQKFTNPYANMENTFEDLTVNQQQADFQAKQGAQQRANIMQNLKGAAGGSGIAALAQSLANQGALQTQQISASIGAQESRNQAMKAKGAANIQSLERQGQQWVQQAEMDKQATLLGMEYGEATGANQALQQAQANQMNSELAQQQAWLNAGENAAGMAGDIQTHYKNKG